jgi:hypothetical protein
VRRAKSLLAVKQQQRGGSGEQAASGETNAKRIASKFLSHTCGIPNVSTVTNDLYLNHVVFLDDDSNNVLIITATQGQIILMRVAHSIQLKPSTFVLQNRT